MEDKLIENIDYNLDELGRMVFTETYNLPHVFQASYVQL